MSKEAVFSKIQIYFHVFFLILHIVAITPSTCIFRVYLTVPVNYYEQIRLKSWAKQKYFDSEGYKFNLNVTIISFEY